MSSKCKSKRTTAHKITLTDKKVNYNHNCTHIHTIDQLSNICTTCTDGSFEDNPYKIKFYLWNFCKKCHTHLSYASAEKLLTIQYYNF